MPMYKSALAELRAEMVAELGPAVAKQIVHFGKHLPAVPSRDEVWSLYDVAKSTRDLLMLRTFYSSGVRNAELVHLRVADIRKDTSELFIQGGKEGEDRLVFVDPGTLAMLLDWCAGQGLRPGDAVFGLKTTRQVHRIVVDCGTRTGIVATYQGMGRSFSPHSLRHACATHAFENGMDLITLKKLLGHHYLETTQIYVHVGLAQEAKVYQKTHEMCRRDAPTHATYVPKKKHKAKR